MKRIIFHAINHIGLGHLNRTLTIARWLTQSIPETEVLFLVEDESKLLAYESFPWIRIPSIYDFQLEGWRKLPNTLQRAIVNRLVQGIIEEFRPSLFIYDTVIWQPIWSAVQESNSKQILIARMGELTRNLFTKFDDMLFSMDKIIVPHNPSQMHQDHLLFKRSLEKIVFAGAILRKGLNEIQPKQTKSKYGLSDHYFNIIVTAGGGGWKETRTFFDCLMHAFSILNNSQRRNLIYVTIVTGPHYEGTIRSELSNIRIINFVPDMIDLMAVGNLVICQAGSTLDEIAEIGVPAICIPAIQADDQAARAEYFSSHFSNIICSRLIVEDIVNHIITLKNRGRFEFIPPFSPSEHFIRTQSIVVKTVVDLLV